MSRLRGFGVRRPRAGQSGVARAVPRLWWQQAVWARNELVSRPALYARLDRLERRRGLPLMTPNRARPCTLPFCYLGPVPRVSRTGLPCLVHRSPINWNDPRKEDTMPQTRKTVPVRTAQQEGADQPRRDTSDGVSSIDVTTLAGVVYSSGKVFDGLVTGRLDTENFLRSGSLEGITSRSDLALLEDLRDVSQFIIDQSHQPQTPITVAFVCAVNAKITRSGALHPGQLRTADQQIGVHTRHGRHTPDAMTDTSLQCLLQESLATTDAREAALDLFVNLAKAQPFEDGNKRTALFVANSLLLTSGAGELLTIPVDEQDPSLADSFNDLLARAYVLNDHTGVKNLLREHGLTPLKGHAG